MCMVYMLFTKGWMTCRFLVDRAYQKSTKGKRDPSYLTILCICYYVDVSKNSGTPKWMVYNGKPY